MLHILNSNTDLNNCLLNCSNNGYCKFDPRNGIYGCECFSFFAGPNCAVDLRPCFSNPCLNEGLCIQNITNSSFQCQCSKNFGGERCEEKKNLCANETCSNQGECIDLYNRTICNCFYLYEGDKCENKSDKMNTIEKVVKTSVIIALLFLVFIWLLVILSDLSNFLFKGKALKQKKNKVFTKVKYIS